jgi:hypothetical protein
MSRLLVTQYQTEVEKIIQYGGSKKETSIRNAFERLLNDYCKPRNYLLIPELDFIVILNKNETLCGTVLTDNFVERCARVSIHPRSF